MWLMAAFVHSDYGERIYSLVHLPGTYQVYECGHVHQPGGRIGLMQATWQDELQVLARHFVGLVCGNSGFQCEQVLVIDLVSFSEHLPPAIWNAPKITCQTRRGVCHDHP